MTGRESVSQSVAVSCSPQGTLTINGPVVPLLSHWTLHCVILPDDHKGTPAHTAPRKNPSGMVLRFTPRSKARQDTGMEPVKARGTPTFLIQSPRHIIHDGSHVSA